MPGHVPHGDEHRHPFSAEAAPDERQCRRRLVVQPLRVVDDDQDGLAGRGIGHEAQHGEADEERVEGLVLHLPSTGVHRGALGFGELAQTLEDR